MKIISKRTIHKLVHSIELQDLAEFDAEDELDAEHSRGIAKGIRMALELIDKHAVPGYNIIRRGGIELSIETYEEETWISTTYPQMIEDLSSSDTQNTVMI